jgi:hypothetical protein
MASGSFIFSPNGTVPIYAQKFILNTTPLAAKTRYALNGIGTYVDMFTADNSTALNQAAPTDVRSGVAYGIGNSQTGRLTVPARGSVALSVNYGPSMPFTATRSGTTATATLAYSYPLVVGDEFTVTGASNAEWNGSYTIASVVSSTSVTFTVPNTHSATAGTGALMQTTGTAVLDPAAVASAVWGAASRTITGGLVDTATTLTNAPTVPTPSQIASQVRTELTSELSNLDASVSSRLASSAYTAPTSAPSASAVATAVRTELGTELGRIDQSISSRLASADYTTPPTTAQIATAVEGSLLNENDGQAVLNAIVGAIGNQNVDEIALVAAIRSDLERSGGKLDSIPTDAAPSAASVATAVWSASTKEITGGTVTTLTNSPDVPTEAEIATAVWGASTKEITGGTVTNLTNAPASVTPADIWDYNARTLTSASGPTAVEIRQEIDANSTKLDVAVGTRLADADYVEPANSDVAAIKAKTDALPSDPADQSLLEAAIAGVTAPSAATVASAVRSELSSELSKVSALNTERLANVATTAIVGNLIAQANS